MKKLTLLGMIFCFSLGITQELKAQEINSLLEKNLKYSHNKENWYPSFSVAVEGLTAEQADWKDDSGNHSIGELVSHLSFWNGRLLSSMLGETPPNFDGDNDQTFEAFEEVEFNFRVLALDAILTEMEAQTLKMSPEEMEGWGETLANIASHNAYHIGQIVFIRKQNGWWR